LEKYIINFLNERITNVDIFTFLAVGMAAWHGPWACATMALAFAFGEHCFSSDQTNARVSYINCDVFQLFAISLVLLSIQFT